jgi:hypothetical protein
MVRVLHGGAARPSFPVASRPRPPAACKACSYKASSIVTVVRMETSGVKPASRMMRKCIIFLRRPAEELGSESSFYLAKGIAKIAIAKLLGVTPNTYYAWLKVRR